MGEMTPITGGALYRDVSGGDTHGDEIRVSSVWVDEDEQVQVQVFTEKDAVASPTTRPVDLQSFIDRIDDTLIRTNTDHEAWEWRN